MQKKREVGAICLLMKKLKNGAREVQNTEENQINMTSIKSKGTNQKTKQDQD